jgi:hypothetical protein
MKGPLPPLPKEGLSAKKARQGKDYHFVFPMDPRSERVARNKETFARAA